MMKKIRRDRDEATNEGVPTADVVLGRKIEEGCPISRARGWIRHHASFSHLTNSVYLSRCQADVNQERLRDDKRYSLKLA
jgi:hypothetical protein